MVHNKSINESRGSLIAGLILAFALAASPATAGDERNYRWVDEDGEVHYGDTMPAEQADNDHAVVDDSGDVRQRSDPAAEEEKGARAEQGPPQPPTYRQVLRADRPDPATAADDPPPAPRSDEVLLKAFGDEQALLDTRQRRLKGIEGRIELDRRQLKQLEQSRQRRLERVRSLEQGSDERLTARKRLEEIEERIAERRAHLNELIAEKERLAAQFKADLKRLRELTGKAASQ
jgi:hypothetical protein